MPRRGTLPVSDSVEGLSKFGPEGRPEERRLEECGLRKDHLHFKLLRSTSNLESRRASERPCTTISSSTERLSTADGRGLYWQLPD